MADRSAGARAVTSLGEFARALVGRSAPKSPAPTEPASLLPTGPKRLISDPNAFFGAGEPQAPVAPPETAGRRLDYDFAYNRTARPRSTEGVGFAQLRALADRHDLTRLAIETRKDQMEALDWTITRVDEQKGDAPPALVEFVKRPDREHDWKTWLRMLLEEMFVTDAPSIYLRRTLGGGFYAAELIDGATITPLLDDTGRRPLPPAPAYQQVLKGVPAADFTREELLYAPRNPRVHKVYGYSPVEQVIVTINLALRRTAHQLAYYDDSNIPPALANVPKDWTAEQIKMFQEWFDFVTAGDVAERSKMRFVPGETKVQLLQTAPLFDEFAEEWFARIIAFAFSLPPTALVRDSNRSTSETTADTAESEGMAPLMGWVKGRMDHLIQTPEGLNAPEWQFTWKTARELDPVKQSSVDVAYITARVRSAKEVALERFGTYDESLDEPDPEIDPSVNGGAKDGSKPDAKPADGEAAKAAGRSLRRRDARWY